MSGLHYREDMDQVRQRLTAWWNGIDLGRPMIHLRGPRKEPLERIEAMTQPQGWSTHYSTSNFDYRVNLSQRACVDAFFLGESVPFVAPDLAPNCLALYLGCRGVEGSDTVWCEPCMESPERARFQVDPENFYWQFTLRLGKEQLRLGRNKFLVQFPDLIEGLDTLAAMRGTEALLADLIDRPEWVRSCLRQITDRYFYYYDVLYDLFRDEVGGSYFWAWAPGRMSKFQCDFSAMISAEMFGEFMVPVLREMTQRVSYCMYHLDGVCALQHLDHLLSLPDLDMIQWTPGAGVPTTDDPRWWPLYHKILDRGKKVFMNECRSPESLLAMKREFGKKLNQCFLSMRAASPDQAEEILKLASS